MNIINIYRARYEHEYDHRSILNVINGERLSIFYLHRDIFKKFFERLYSMNLRLVFTNRRT